MYIYGESLHVHVCCMIVYAVCICMLITICNAKLSLLVCYTMAACGLRYMMSGQF